MILLVPSGFHRLIGEENLTVMATDNQALHDPIIFESFGILIVVFVGNNLQVFLQNAMDRRFTDSVRFPQLSLNGPDSGKFPGGFSDDRGLRRLRWGFLFLDGS